MVDFEALAAPFPPERISWRPGSMTKDKSKAMALAYLNARDVMERLDDVCGPGGWQCRYSHAQGRTVCDLAIKIDGEWVWKADGAGDSDIEAEKGALSDAFKRSAVRWGVGRYLYDVSSPWVEIDEWKKIKEHERPKLEAILQSHSDNIEWGDSEDRATLKAMANGIRSMLKTADDVRQYRDLNEGVISQLRVKARAHINQILDQIEESAVNQAA